VANMQWQTTAAAKAKDRWERKSCGVQEFITTREGLAWLLLPER